MDANTVFKGLEGVIVSETKVGFVDGEAGRLVYRGFNIEELVQHSSYEEVSFLLINGHLPTASELKSYRDVIMKSSSLPSEVIDLIWAHSNKYPTSLLRTAVSLLGANDTRADHITDSDQKEIGVELVGKVPALVSSIRRAAEGGKYVKPSPDLSLAGNMLYQSTGKKPDKSSERIMDVCLMLHADHGSNASTFSSLVTISSLSDIYSALTSAIGTLKGPLHGGANEMALKLIMEVGKPENVEEVIGGKLEKKEKIMGFGHRVYKVYDPRARILKGFAREVTARNGKGQLFDTAQKIEDVMISKLGTKGIFPNVDFYSGMVYDSLGFHPDMFTSLFAASRTSGWVARSLEYVSDNKLFRPRSSYVGERGPLAYIPIEKRN
ncbi:MAG: citrate synthase/methylcitrate synthase [Candidatus Thermoplasmatota archaeon]|nr:citrate synthase/methylcitrate synthase [Candidatus Thermoplasmatota archaeon]MCL5799949.1 citrate synthase/methylcitrate synthase [Candidatus Thermoplasmatota archaeon]